MKNIFSFITFLIFSFSFSQSNFTVYVDGLVVGDSARVIMQKGVENRIQKWAKRTDETNPVQLNFEVGNGEWALFIDATGYTFPTSTLIQIPEQTSATYTLTPLLNDDYNYTWQDDDSYVGHATQVYINEPTQIVVINDTVDVPSDYSSIKLRNEYGIVLSNDEEPWSMDDSYRLYKMFESLPFNTFGENSVVDFSNGDNVRGVFTLSNDLLDQDLILTTVDGIKNGRVGIDAFTYANPQIVTIDGIKGKFYSKRLYNVVVNFLTDFAADDDVVNWIAQESFGVRFMLPDQETEDLMGEDSSNFQEFYDWEKMEILAMFEELPDGFQKQDGLQYLVRRVNGQDNPTYPDAAAIAWTGFNTIEWMSKAFTGEINDVRRLILHEKAHFLWAYSFDQELKDDWAEIGGWFEDPSAASGWSTYQTTAFVSPYAHLKSPNEDMAESIAFYLTNPDALLTVSVQKYEFIRDRIMHGTRYIAMIPDELTFTVYNLFPDYVFPGKVTKMEIDVVGESNEDKIVTIRATLNSIDPNLDGAAGGYIRMNSLVGTIHDVHMNTENGQALDSVLVGTTTFSKLEKSGYWNLTSFTINDQVGNQRFENTSTLGWKLYIENPLEDILPPAWNYNLEMEVVEDYFESGYDTNVSNEEDGVFMQAIKFAYSVYDNSPMLRTITRIFHPTLDEPDAQVYEKQIQGRPSVWDTPEWEEDYNSDKYFEQYLAIPDWFPSGYYSVSQVNMQDLGGNYSATYFVNDTTDFNIPADQALKLFKDTRDSIYVETLYPDYLQAELDLNNITIIAEPTNPEAPNGETRVDITMIARDLSDYPGHESGVAAVGFTLRDPLGGIHGFQTGNSTMNHPELDIYDFNPELNSNWGVYHFDLVLPVGSPPGEWGMASADIRDKAGNIKRYSFVEYVRFDIIESDVELEVPLEAIILSDYVNAANVENISAAISCIPCEGLNYVYTIYSLTGGAVVQGTGIFESNEITLNQIDTSGVLDGNIILTVQVTDSESQLIATKSTEYIKDTFYPNSYYSSSNIQEQGTSNLDGIVIAVVVEGQDVDGTYDLDIENVESSNFANSVISMNGNIETENFDITNINFYSIDDGYLKTTLTITDFVGNVGEPEITYYYKEDGSIYFVGDSIIDTDEDGHGDFRDNCPLISNTDQSDIDSDGIGDVCDDDMDGDTILNADDNCQTTANTDQSDIDSDGIGDVCDDDMDGDTILNADDNCQTTANTDQSDIDSDGIGDVCDDDMDGDTILNADDNCQTTANTDQSDIDSDGIGDVCDDDMDGDTILNADDNCQTTANTDQSDIDSDGIGDVCDDDMDGDTILNADDNCQTTANTDQSDIDSDGIGDVCDDDMDGDTILNADDNCQTTANTDQSDIDSDGIGDVCDDDMDGDTILNADDNCQTTANTDQSDIDSDGIGDVCDDDMDGDTILNADDNCQTTANTDQSDIDSDGIGDVCDDDMDGDTILNADDNCQTTANTDQSDIDSDGIGDVCDDDMDGDTILNADDNCQTTANTDQSDIDSDGIGDVCDDDMDGDTILNADDNCQTTANTDQSDIDSDGIGDVCDDDMDGDTILNADDNCQTTANTDQSDIDSDGIGDVCDDDMDGDTILNADDNCQTTANTDQSDIDSDGIGDVCDDDMDGDTILNADDNCQTTANTDQSDIDSDGIGDVCDDDMDGDTILNADDNCQTTANTDQSDIDSDGIGDVCDDDMDGDTILNADDNCQTTANTDQSDIDSDGIGDVCDDDMDGDTILNADDNCQTTANTDQSDIDSDGIGDVCDDDMDGDTILNADDNCQTTANTDQSDIDSDGIGDVCDDDLAPNDNYLIFTNSITCINANNGSINLQVNEQSIDYLLNFNNQTYELNESNGHSFTTNGLSPGIYNLCITIPGIESYEQCFEIEITQPDSFSLETDVDYQSNIIYFELEGAEQYYIVYNNQVHSTTSNQISFNLNNGENNFEIYTDLECQGHFTKNIYIDEKLSYYPNPIKNILSLIVPSNNLYAKILIFDINGKLITQKNNTTIIEGKIELDLSNLKSGNYILNIETSNLNKIIKIVKK